MRQNATEFKWTRQREDAAQLVADGKLTGDQISERVGIDRATLLRWKQHPEFAAKVDELVEAWAARVRGHRFARKEGRLEKYYADLDATDAILAERGEELAEIPGGATGFICRDYKGKDADTPVYMFDAALFRERRATLNQIADEMGQLVKRSEITGKDGDALKVVVEYVTEPPKAEL